MELDLQRFYKLNRRVLMWIIFFGILFLLREFFSLVFLTFIFTFVMRKVAKFIIANTRLPYRAAVAGSYLVAVACLVLLISYAIPRVVSEGAEFSRRVPNLLRTVAVEIQKASREYGVEPALARYVDAPRPAEAPATSETPGTPQPAGERVQIDVMVNRMQETVLGLLPGVMGQDKQANLEEALLSLSGQLVGGTLKFLLAFLLSFLILFDFGRITREMLTWRESSVGKFFHEAASSVIDFSRVVGTAFQCQIVIALLNASITCVGLVVLRIEPVLLLTTIVFLFGLIPVLGVFISSVPIILIAFNNYGLQHALVTLGMIVVVHLLEAYVFNPRIYAARFHLNPVIVLIILLVAHELFGVWGMLLGIPVTHYVLNLAQLPSTPRRRRRSRRERREARQQDQEQEPEPQPAEA